MEKVNEQQDMSEKMIHVERAAFEAWLEVEIGNRFAPEFDLMRNEEGGYRYQPAAAYWTAWQARSSLPVGVPDGYALVPVKPTIEMLTYLIPPDCFIDQDLRENYAAMIAAAPAAPTVKAEQVLCSEERPCIPCFTDNGECAASHSQLEDGSVAEVVEVVAWRYRHSEQEKWQAGVERKSLWETEPLMAVAQHQRIVAALSAQLSAPERVSVPKLAGLKSVNHQLGIVALSFRSSEQTQEAVRELRALLASNTETGG